jgi:WD40 repeat protein
VLTGSWDNTARQWDAQTGQPIGEPLRHGASVYAVAYSPDGKRVLTGSLDNTARQWDAQTGQPIGEPLRHGASVSAVAYSPDGKHVLSQTSQWFYYSDVTENGLTPKSSRFYSGLWKKGYRFLDSTGVRLQAVVPGVADSLSNETVRFDVPEAEALLGNPADLLQDWQKRLGLKFDASQNQKVVPTYPVETIRVEPVRPRP